MSTHNGLGKIATVQLVHCIKYMEMPGESLMQKWPINCIYSKTIGPTYSVDETASLGEARCVCKLCVSYTDLYQNGIYTGH